MISSDPERAQRRVLSQSIIARDLASISDTSGAWRYRSQRQSRRPAHLKNRLAHALASSLRNLIPYPTDRMPPDHRLRGTMSAATFVLPSVAMDNSARLSLAASISTRRVPKFPMISTRPWPNASPIGLSVSGPDDAPSINRRAFIPISDAA